MDPVLIYITLSTAFITGAFYMSIGKNDRRNFKHPGSYLDRD